MSSCWRGTCAYINQDNMVENWDTMMFICDFDNSGPRANSNTSSNCGSSETFANFTSPETTDTAVSLGHAPKVYCLDVSSEREEEAER